MFNLKRLFAHVFVALLATLAIAAPVSAETETPAAPLPFDPLALELILPHDNAFFNVFGVRTLPTTSKPIGKLTYQWAGKTKTIDQFLSQAGTDSFLVLDDGKIAYEKYYDINNAFSQHQSWSMAKSITSALIGVAVAEGRITSIEDPVTKYMPELAANGYNGVSIKHLLQMSSGVGFKETYLEFNSDDVNWLIADPAINFLSFGLLGRTLKQFATSPSHVRTFTPGSEFRYSSLDSQVLGMVLQRAVGKTPADYLEQKIWKPMGAGWPAYMLTDREGTNFSFGNNYATLRDYGRFGELFRNKGKVGSKQIIPAAWVAESTKAWVASGLIGYGYQWWTTNDTSGDFFANGFEGQNIYVSPSRKTTIVKLSDDFNSGARAEENLRVMKTIASWTAVN